MTTSARTYFAQRPVFRFDEFASAYRASGQRSPRSIGAILSHHVKSGHLINVRRGLYAKIPEGENAKRFQVDPYLIASRASHDAVIAYHSALQLLGKTHSLYTEITYLTTRKAKPFDFQGTRFVPVLVPRSLRSLPDFGGGLRQESRQGLTVRVTGYERTLVDMLDVPDYGGGWEEIWRSLESVEFFDLDFVVEYALRLGSALTISRVGFFLEQHRDTLMTEERHLMTLQAHIPKRPQYFERRRRKGGELVRHWNLIVPKEVLERSWEEVA